MESQFLLKLRFSEFRRKLSVFAEKAKRQKNARVMPAFALGKHHLCRFSSKMRRDGKNLPAC